MKQPIKVNSNFQQQQLQAVERLISFINISADVSKPTCCHPPESLFLFLVQVLQSVENN
jgi:hypothetical protein